MLCVVSDKALRHVWGTHYYQRYSMASLGAGLIATWLLYLSPVMPEHDPTLAMLAWTLDLRYSFIIMIVYLIANFGLTEAQVMSFLINQSNVNWTTLIEQHPSISRSVRSRALSTLIYFAIALVGVYEWYIIIAEWTATHCFLNDFIDVATPRGISATMFVFVVYHNIAAAVWSHWRSVAISMIVIHTAFYNTTAAIAMYCMKEEWFMGW